jgi:hypothetical protein
MRVDIQELELNEVSCCHVSWYCLKYIYVFLLIFDLCFFGVLINPSLYNSAILHFYVMFLEGVFFFLMSVSIYSFWVTVAHPLSPVKLVATNVPADG